MTGTGHVELIANGKAVADRYAQEAASRRSPGGVGSDADEHPTLLDGLMSAADLDRIVFAPLTEHVPGLVVEGFGVLAGPPKVGKSWLVGNIACGCACGGTVLNGIHVHGRSVLLVSLEDSPRRLQSRLRTIMCDRDLPRRLDVLTDVPRGWVMPAITEWLNRHRDDDDPPLVILDTLGRAREQRRAGDDPYIADYQFGARIKAVVDDVPGAALLAVHHTRKMAADDFVDTLSGTQGIAGSADYIIVLSRKRQSDEGILSVTGRDLEENEFAVRKDSGLWSLDGLDIMDAAATVTTRRQQAAETKLGNQSLDAVTFVDSRETTAPADLAAHLKIDNQAAGKLLGRLHDGGYIDKLHRGTYASLDGKSGKSRKNQGQTDSGSPVLFPQFPDFQPGGGSGAA